MPARAALFVLAALSLPSLAAPAHAAGKKYALLVGVKEYDHDSLSTLKYTENDVEELGRVLREVGYSEVVILTAARGKNNDALRPTAKNIRDRLKKLSDKVNKHDLLLIALAGHGMQWPVVDPETKREKDESFFCPSDAKPRSERTLEELKKTMIPLGELFRTLDESGAGVRLMLVDACRNDAKQSRSNMGFDDLPRTRRGTAVLFSCKSGERAYETNKLGKGHGVFFYHVIQAMKSADRLSWSRLADRVIDRVTDDVPAVIGDGARQTPHEIKNIEGKSPLVVEKAPAAGDPAEAAAWCRKGEDYFRGRGVAKDYEEAARWFRRAAAAGDALAMSFLGYMHEIGLGMARDQEEAVGWYRRAAERGEVFATYNLGARYAEGRGVAADSKEAVGLFRKAAAKGHADATYYLGIMHAQGRGTEKDEKEALKWFRKAADKGVANAMGWIANFYADGRGGLEKDEKVAIDWYHKACAGGDSTAMWNLGNMYLAGRGVEADRAEALKWYRKSASLGYEPAKRKVKELEAGE